jgi:hypothetical protein
MTGDDMSKRPRCNHSPAFKAREALEAVKGEITGHLREMYGIDVSPDLISTVTDAVLEEVQRPAPAGGESQGALPQRRGCNQAALSDLEPLRERVENAAA